MNIATLFVSLVLIALAFYVIREVLPALGVPSTIQRIVLVFAVVVVVLLTLTYFFPSSMPEWARLSL